MKKNKKLKILYNFLLDKKYSYIKILDISKISVIADYFVILSTDNIKSAETLTDQIEDLFSMNNIELRGKEGYKSGWNILDYNDVVIHIFNDENRTFYNIEKNWADAKYIDVDTNFL